MLIGDFLHQITAEIMVLHDLDLTGQGCVSVAPDVVQPGVTVQKVHMDQVASERLKPLLQRFTCRAGGDIVHHHLQIRMVDLSEHTLRSLQIVDQVALVPPQGLHDQQDVFPLRHTAQPLQMSRQRSHMASASSSV